MTSNDHFWISNLWLYIWPFQMYRSEYLLLLPNRWIWDLGYLGKGSFDTLGLGFLISHIQESAKNYGNCSAIGILLFSSFGTGGSGLEHKGCRVCPEMHACSQVLMPCALERS